MDWNWYQTFAVIALVISVSLSWEVYKLRKHFHTDDLTPTKKWKKAVSGTKYVPKHKPDLVPELADEDDWRFFRDFSHVADYLNELYADEPWSFENTGELHIAHYASENGSEREILIRYNQQKTGTIKLSCVHYRRDDPLEIQAELSLQNGRVFGGHTVFGLAQSVSQIVTYEAEKVQENRASIMAAMIDAMWQVGDEAMGNPDLELTYWGNAEWFLKYQAPKMKHPNG